MKSRQDGVGGMVTEEHKENSGGDEYVHYVNYSDGFKGEYICPN